jgi:bacillolysin
MKNILSLTVLLLLTSVVTLAQKPESVIEGKQGMYPSFISFSPGSGPDFIKGKIVLADAQARAITGSSTFTKPAGFEKDISGAEHYRYQQVINGLAVEHAVYVVHTFGKKVYAENGKWIKNVPASLPAVTLGESSALAYALQFVNARTYKWQDAKEEAFLKREKNNKGATFYPKAQLVLYSGEEEVIPSALRPAYKFDIYASDPVSRQIVFVDAVNGAILGKRELLHTTNANGTAVTGYSGTQSITTDYTGATYRLRETGRGDGIQTFNMQKSTNYSNAIDFTDADNNWNNVNANKDQYATDAHWGAEKTYDYYLTKYGRNSIDNAGFAILSYVHYGVNYFNAFWDGSRMTYGDGGAADGNKPLTSLDVCGHEITHGLTEFTSSLVYSNESGALNEGFSDIFGTAIEFYARPGKADWLIGGDFLTIRSMSNPNAYGQPDTYKGTNWYTGANQDALVHTNSGVLNFWFYLLSTGGNGTNDFGIAYNVTGLGIDKAAAIAYRTNTIYLTPTSKYADARTASIQAATDLYGSAEATQTANAWDAVGVGVVLPPPICSDKFESNETRATAKSLPPNLDNVARIGTATDKDWYKFITTQSAPNLSVVLSNLPKDYDVKLYNSSGTQLAVSQNGGTSYETITKNTSVAATYYLQVYGYAGATSTSCYTLRVTTSGFNLFSEGTEGLISSEKTNLDDINSLTVYPNPAKDKLVVYVNAENSNRTQLSMMDITGRIVMRQPVQLQKGLNTVNVNIPRLATGTYVVKMEGLRSVKVQVIQ